MTVGKGSTLEIVGSIFVQIGDENVHRVRALIEEVFGDENCISQIIIVKTSAQERYSFCRTCAIISFGMPRILVKLSIGKCGWTNLMTQARQNIIVLMSKVTDENSLKRNRLIDAIWVAIVGSNGSLNDNMLSISISGV